MRGGGGRRSSSSLAFRGGGRLSLYHCCRHSHDGIGYFINLMHRFAGRDPHHRYPAGLEPRVAAHVALLADRPGRDLCRRSPTASRALAQ